MKLQKMCLAMAAVLVLGLCACGGGSTSSSAGSSSSSSGSSSAASIDKTRTVTFGYSGMPATLDPTVMLSLAAQVVDDQLYDPLLTRNFDGTFSPRIAKEYKVSDDALTYTFILDERATFSNGDKITADDVVFSMQYFQASAQHAYIYKDITSMKAVDSKTVEVVFSTPHPTFLASCASTLHLSILCKKAVQQYGSDYGKSIDKTVCSGAYVATDWQNEVSVTFKARDDYFLGKADIENIKFYKFADTNSAIVSLQKGDLDIYFSPVSGTAYTTLSSSSNVVLESFPSSRFEDIHFNMKNGMFTDIRMRQAVAYAVKAEEALAVGVDNLGKTTRYPGDGHGAIAADPDYTSPNTISYDLAKAKALVAECGNTGKKVVIKSYSTDPYPALNTWLQSVLNSIGLDSSVELMERAAWLDACNNSQIEILILSWNGASYDMDESLGNTLKSANAGTSGNYGFYSNSTVDGLFAAANKLTDVNQRAAKYKEIIDQMWKDVPLIPLYQTTNVYPHSSQIKTDNARSYRLYGYQWTK